VNIGVVLQSIKERRSWCQVLSSSLKVRCLEPRLSEDVIQYVYADLLNRWQQLTGCDGTNDIGNPEVIDSIFEEYGGHVKLTQPRLCLVQNPEQEIAELYNVFVAPGSAAETGTPDRRLHQSLRRGLG